MYRLTILLSMLMLFSLHKNFARQMKQEQLSGAEHIKVVWSFEELPGKSKSVSKFIFYNTSSEKALKEQWSLYFNCLKDIDTATITKGFKLKHIAGDLYRIYPSKNAAIQPGDSLVITFLFGGRAVNFTDAPSGLFFEENNKIKTVKNYTVNDQASSIKRVLSAEKLFTKYDNIKRQEQQPPVIIPTPLVYKTGAGSFELNSNTVLVSDASFSKEADYLFEELDQVLAVKIKRTQVASVNCIQLKKAALPEHEYRLSITADAITISAADNQSVFYGIQSLKALLPPGSWAQKSERVQIPVTEIIDKPRFGYRGLMIDISRNFQSLPQLLKVIDLMAFYKLNVLHFHFADDESWRLQIPSLPELTEKSSKRGWPDDQTTNLAAGFGSGPDPAPGPDNGYYTREQFITLLQYAHRRHITVVPEIETPGHARAAIKSMDLRYDRYMKQGNREAAEKYLLRDRNDQSKYYSAQMFDDNVLCVALPSVYTFLEKVTDELVAMYHDAAVPFTNIHFGGDELPAGAWTHSPACKQLMSENKRLKSTDDLWYYFIDKVKTIAQKRGLVFSGWEEVALRKNYKNGKLSIDPNPDFLKNNFKVDVWNNVVGYGIEDLPYRLANAGYKVVMTCTGYFYMDLANDTSYLEPGHYWGGFIDPAKVYSFIPYNYYLNTTTDYQFNPIAPDYFLHKERLTEQGKSNILGLKATLFSEKIKTAERMEYMLLPRLILVAEKAWAEESAWETITDPVARDAAFGSAFAGLMHTIGARELPRLDYYHQGFHYRIPPPGAIVKDHVVQANSLFTGYTIRYTTDGSEPDRNSKIYVSPLIDNALIHLRVFNQKGLSSISTIIDNRY